VEFLSILKRRLTQLIIQAIIKQAKSLWNQGYYIRLVLFLSERSISSNPNWRALLIKRVPQESVQGPLLFLINIIAIHKSSNKLHFFLFVDDTTLLS